MRTDATLDFCNSICHEPNRFDIDQFRKIPGDWPTSRLNASALFGNPITSGRAIAQRAKKKGRRALRRRPFLANCRLVGPVPLRSVLRAPSKTKVHIALH
jgi:hypothetical protein